MFSRYPDEKKGRTNVLAIMVASKLQIAKRNSIKSISCIICLAEREGFEPPIGLHLCRISSAVHSTTLPPLQAIEVIRINQGTVAPEISKCYRIATQSLQRASFLRFDRLRQRAPPRHLALESALRGINCRPYG